MTLIKSISGIRGTIGGKVGDNLTPVDAVKFASAYGTFLKNNTSKEKLTVVIGRDARISGPMIHNLVVNTLIGLGINVIDLGLSTTPTVEIAIVGPDADLKRKDLDRFFIPNKVVLGTTDTSELPLLMDKTDKNGHALIYVCYDKTCQLPVSTVEEALIQINR